MGKEGEDKNLIKNVFLLDEISKGGYYMAFGKVTPEETVNKFKAAFEKVHPTSEK